MMYTAYRERLCVHMCTFLKAEHRITFGSFFTCYIRIFAVVLANLNKVVIIIISQAFGLRSVAVQCATTCPPCHPKQISQITFSRRSKYQTPYSCSQIIQWVLLCLQGEVRVCVHGALLFIQVNSLYKHRCLAPYGEVSWLRIKIMKYREWSQYKLGTQLPAPLGCHL